MINSPGKQGTTCPHCGHKITAEVSWGEIGYDVSGKWEEMSYVCPNAECRRIVIYLRCRESVSGPILAVRMVYPVGGSRPIPKEVPGGIAEDFREACTVLNDSPKASAALSRRCLQHILRGYGGTTKRDLAEQIQEILDQGRLPTYLADEIDAIRNIGNFAAHPLKSKQTGDILPVEPGEAEWNLEVLESLFDFFFVAPARSAAKKAALNAKLDEAGKPNMKET